MKGAADDAPPVTPRKKSRNRATGNSQDSAYLASPRSPTDSLDKKKHSQDDDRYGNGYRSDESSEEDSSDRDPFVDERDGLLDLDIDLDPRGAVSTTLPVDEEEHIQAADALGTHDEQPTAKSKEAERPVSWSSLPRKDQLFLLTFSRLAEPLTQTSLQAYMFYQLRSFNPDLPDSTISAQAGMLQAAFTGAQFCTAFLWGRVADSALMGRKRVILVGLAGTSLGALGFGFSQSFRTALFWRMLGGALNGNVGVMRTMISETIKEKKYQSRAFLLMPMTFNIGVIVGPILGGMLADPVSSYPRLFGENSVFGGEHGVAWMQKWRYALPNIVTAMFMCVSLSLVTLGLEETLHSRRDKRDWGLQLGDLIKRHVFRLRSHTEYQSLALVDPHDIELQPAPTPAARTRHRLPFRRIFTPNLIMVLIAHGILAAHLGVASNLWFIFLSTPRYVPPTPGEPDPNQSLHLPADYRPHPPLTFTGGLGLPPASIGTSLAILGSIGITLQLLLYPRLSFRHGTIKCYRFSLALFPLVYILMPFLSLIPSRLPAPAPASGPLFWAALVLVLALQVTARTFALPGTTILVNNACPHPSVLGTVHGLGQSASSLMRTLGPLAGATGYGAGLRAGVVGAVFWGLAGWAAIGFVAGLRVREGNGHEIWLEGEKEETE